MQVEYDVAIKSEECESFKEEIMDFADLFCPKEQVLYVLKDKLTEAIFCECHVTAGE